MQVYRIARDKYANNLSASGVGARWNPDDTFVLYTSEARSLATLEVLVNTNRVSLLRSYKLMCISAHIKKGDIQTIEASDLPKDWRGQGSYKLLRQLGAEWYYNQKKMVLKVPSAIIPQESNYILNYRHPDFSSKVSLSEVENFVWDERLIKS